MAKYKYKAGQEFKHKTIKKIVRIIEDVEPWEKVILVFSEYLRKNVLVYVDDLIERRETHVCKAKKTIQA